MFVYCSGRKLWPGVEELTCSEWGRNGGILFDRVDTGPLFSPLAICGSVIGNSYGYAIRVFDKESRRLGAGICIT